MADENPISTGNADRERAVGVGAVMLEVSDKVRDLRQTGDGKLEVRYAAKCFVMHGADRCFIGRGWRLVGAGSFAGRRHGGWSLSRLL